ncbi:MAG: response regulator [Thermoanaerobaculum sp.]|nr:response regulator [Thermoanaerobaculum sp.]
MGGKILLADDSVTIQKVVELTFAETDFTVVTVGSGSELLQQLRKENPDIVLCDVVMPDISGYEVCQKIKSDPTTLHIPVVLLTGTFEPFDRDRALAAGCDAIVTKPFEARALIATVEELTARSSQAVPQAAEEEVLGLGVPEGVPALDFTTTGFDRMVPPPEPSFAPPEHGLELTGSSVHSTVAPAPPPPPELAAPPRPAPAQTPETPLTAPWIQEEPQAKGEVVTVSGPGMEEQGVPFVSPRSTAPAFASEGMAGSPAVPEEEVETVPPGGFPEAPSASSSLGVAAAELDGLVQRVVEEVLRRLPATPAPAPAQLSDEDVERVARKVLELATPLLEKVAWEVVPDLAEMLVRQRIAELEAAAENS